MPVGEVCRCGLGWFGYAPRIRHLTASGRGVVMARFEEGWTAQAYRFALDPTPTPTPAQERALRSHAGGAQFRLQHDVGGGEGQPGSTRGGKDLRPVPKAA